MGRGYIYHISADPEVFPGLDESDFYESLDSMACDYVENCGAGRADILSGLKNSLKSAGFEIQEENLPDACVFAFCAGDENELKTRQGNWFRGWYNRFKELSQAITLEQFACGTEHIYPIQEALNDNYDDAVYLDMGTGPAFYAFMRFMRTLLPDKTYYVEDACVFMH